MAKYYFERLGRLDEMIRKRKSGPPNLLAKKLGVSRRTVFDYIELMKELGATIRYDHTKKSYYYEEKGKFNFRFIKEIEHI